MNEGRGAAERELLLRLARSALRESLGAGGDLEDELRLAETAPALREGHGAFVSLKRSAPGGREAVRGCIGCMSSHEPLYRNVVDLARKAAFEDPRFTPLAAGDLERVRIEISVLSPLHPVAGPRDIVIGRHGVELRRGSSGAVFLPQVAVEQGWNVETLLVQLSRKARLADDAWSTAELAVFEAEVFGESRIGGD